MAECQCGRPKHEDESLCDDCALIAWRERFAQGCRDIGMPCAARKDGKLKAKSIRPLSDLLVKNA